MIDGDPEQTNTPDAGVERRGCPGDDVTGSDAATGSTWRQCDGKRLLAWENLPGIDKSDEAAAVRAVARDGLVLYMHCSTRDGEPDPAMARHNAETFAAWKGRKPAAPVVTAGDDDGNQSWITAAVRDELAKLRDAQRGTRNDTLNAVGLRLARLLPDQREWLRGQLIDACEHNGEVAYKGLRSVEATIDSAYLKADLDGPANVPQRTTRADGCGSVEQGPSTDTFWSTRPILAHIHNFAQSRMVGPWGVLGVVLVRAVCQLPPQVVLPPIIGGHQSLNMLVALIGGSGEGKGGSEAVGATAVGFRHGVGETLELPLGSGEGIARSLMAGDDEPEHGVIFTASEIDSVNALFSRRGSTLEPELRKLYSGETLGFTNAQKHTRTRVAAHSYRACLITGVQPTRGTFLLKGADAGTPQRFLWLPVHDPSAPDDTPPRVDPIMVDVPAMFGPDAHMEDYRSEIVVPEAIRQQMRRHRLDVLRHAAGVDPLDGHRMLCQLKVAAALMTLDGRHQISMADWELAATVLAVSDHTREQVARAGADKARRANKERAQAEVERDEYIDASKLKAAKAILLRRLDKSEGAVSRNDLRHALKSTTRREYFDPAITELIDEGLLEETTLSNGTSYQRGPK